MFVEGDDGAGRRGVGVFVQDHRGFLRFGVAAQHHAADQQVHVQVGLVQPEAADLRHFQTGIGHGVLDHFRGHRAHVLEYLAALLAEQFVRLADAGFVEAVQEAEIVADVVGEAGFQLGVQDFPAVRALGGVGPFHDDGGAGIAKDEVAVAVAPVQVARGNFRIQHQHRARLAALHRCHGLLDAEGGRRAGYVHVEAVADDAQRFLHFHGHGRVAALHVGAGHQHHVDIGCGFAGAVHGLLGGRHADLCLQRQFIVGAFRDVRHHALRIQDAGFFHHVARLDAGRFLDEGHARWFQCRDRAFGDAAGVVRVELFDVGIEAGHQLFVGNRLCWSVEAGTADDGLFHD